MSPRSSADTGPFQRFAVYHVPGGAFYEAGAAWLGWDSMAGRPVPHPGIANLPEPAARLTLRPRPYGLHATIKPPFYLAPTQTPAGLAQAFEVLCTTLTPVSLPDLTCVRMGRFVALAPSGPSAAVSDLAATVVGVLDGFRASPSAAEIEKRLRPGLSDRQRRHVQRWGSPHVMEDFRFHITLTGPSAQADLVRDVLADHFAPVLPEPCVIGTLALMGQDVTGDFHVLRQVALTG